MLFRPASRSFAYYAIACVIYGTLIALPSVHAAPQLLPVTPVTPSVLNVDLGVRALVGDPTCPAVDSNGGLTGRVFAAVTLGEQATVSALNVNLANIRATVQTCICVTAGVDVANIVPSTTINTDAAADIRAAASASAALSALDGLLGVGTNVLNVNLTPQSAAPCGGCTASQYPGCTSGVCTCIDCPMGQFYSASRAQCVVSPSPLARARVKARSEALAAETDNRCSVKDGKCNQPRDVLHLRQATREAVVERYNRTITNAARKPVRYQRLELVSQ